MTLLSHFMRKTGSTDPAPRTGGPDSHEATKSRNKTSRKTNYCQLLTQNQELTDAEKSEAWEALRSNMALVPEGQVNLLQTDPQSFGDTPAMIASVPVHVDAVYLDRFCVTNDEFAEFVSAGCYGIDHLWPTEILSNVLQFVDRTGHAGPRYWKDGQPLAHQGNHPVTGICWYEANAYAHWRGKRLPTPAEWQRAATWSLEKTASGTVGKYPWGDSFDSSRCNTFNSGIGFTVPVDEFYNGCTPNGVYQLIGNVWEWTSAIFECDTSANGDRVLTEFPLAEIRGGAYDTYFATQATALFRTGQYLLHRGINLGFRCCIGADQLTQPTDPYAFLEE